MAWEFSQRIHKTSRLTAITARKIISSARNTFFLFVRSIGTSLFPWSTASPVHPDKFKLPIYHNIFSIYMESIGITGNNPVLSRTFSWLYEKTAGNYYKQLQRSFHVFSLLNFLPFKYKMRHTAELSFYHLQMQNFSCKNQCIFIVFLH